MSSIGHIFPSLNFSRSSDAALLHYTRCLLNLRILMEGDQRVDLKVGKSGHLVELALIAF